MGKGQAHRHGIAAATAYIGACLIPPLGIFLYSLLVGPVFITLEVVLQLFCWCVHYARRAYEVLSIHKYSRPGSVFDDVGVVVYYYSFAFWVFFDIYRGNSTAFDAAPLSLMFFALFWVGEFGNNYFHLKLASLRRSATDKSVTLPSGGMFDVVLCPHYTCELISWVSFAGLANCSNSGIVFVLASFAAMLQRAVARRSQYRSLFDGKHGRPQLPSRKMIIPYIL